MAFAYAPWFDSQDVMNNDSFMSYVCSNHRPDEISLFGLDCDDFLSHMCAVDTELETPKFGRRSARERFVKTCGVHWGYCGVVCRYRLQQALISHFPGWTVSTLFRLW